MRLLFFVQVWKKDWWGSFETDEGGPEKQFIFLFGLLNKTIYIDSLNSLNLFLYANSEEN